ncbi:MAG: hypothetical protein IPJ71_11630 [Bdellovibrionales bacterium]|nr:hypothetical protein [Bdellovibrionales bacterium]
MDAFLSFFIHYLPNIIQWSIAAILLLLGSLFTIMIFGKSKKDPESEMQIGDLGALEKTLKDILKSSIGDLSSSGALKTSGNESNQGSGPFQANSGSLEQMMRELAQKDAEIEVLKQTQNQSSPVVEKAIEVDVSGYVEKIRDLEGKLKEYEIIEDDIADLSHFKEENAKLKKKIEELSGTAVTDSLGQELVEKSETPVNSSGQNSTPLSEKGEDLVAEFAAAVDEQHKNASSPVLDPSSIDIQDDILKDASVELTSDLEILNRALGDLDGNQTEVVSNSQGGRLDELKNSEPPNVRKSRSAGEEDPENDILAEFSRSLGKMSQPPAEEGPNLEKKAFVEEPSPIEFTKAKAAVDTDKMLEEMAGLGSFAQNEGESVLEGNVDTDKMAEEANKLVVNE